MEDSAKKNVSEVYYDSDSAFKFYSIINGIDYSGIGRFPSMVNEIDPTNNKEYNRGDGLSVTDATMKRDEKMLGDILQHMPKDKKIKILELGAGRGGLSRYLTKELIKVDKRLVNLQTELGNEETSLIPADTNLDNAVVSLTDEEGNVIGTWRVEAGSIESALDSLRLESIMEDDNTEQIE